ncbi:MAG: hypothetical protein DRN06_08855 [Thermoprotei archaeon]|nr:MAG: hypothetical protein DRN06_08855 [Thermoprotei archaeon]
MRTITIRLKPKAIEFLIKAEKREEETATGLSLRLREGMFSARCPICMDIVVREVGGRLEADDFAVCPHCLAFYHASCIEGMPPDEKCWICKKDVFKNFVIV